MGAISDTKGFIKRQAMPFKINMVRVSSMNFLVTLVVYYQSIYIVALGAAPFQLGLAMGVAGIAGAVISMPAGWLSYRYGVKRLFLFGSLTMAFGALALAIASDWIVTIPGLVLSLLGLRLMEAVCPMVCSNCLRNEERATGMQLCDTIAAAPRLVAPMIGAVLVTNFGGMGVGGIRPLYHVQFVGFVLIFVFVYRLFSDPFRVVHDKVKSHFMTDMRELFRRGRMLKRWLFYRSLSSLAFFITLQAGFVSLYANTEKYADQYILGLMASTSMIIPLTLSIVVGRLTDSFGRKKVLFLTIPIYCVSLVTLILAQDPVALITSSILQGFLLLNLVTEGVISVELVPPDLFGKWLGIFGLTRGLIGVISPIIAGQLWTLISPSSIFILLIGVQLALIPLLATIPETLLKKS